MFPPHRREELERNIAVANERGHHVWESEHVRRDGTVFPALMDVTAVRDERGRLLYRIVSVQDITERKRAEEALRRGEERFRRAVYEAPFPVMIHAEDGRVLAVNREWTEITGYTREDIPTINQWTEKAYGERAAQSRAIIARLFSLKDGAAERDTLLRTASGEERFWHFRSALLGAGADGRRLAISMAADMTERKRLEAELLRASQLSLVGELAAGLAHEIKNPLAGIKGAVDILIRRKAEGDPEIEVLEEVRHAVGRVDLTVRTLLERARARQPKPSRTSLSEVAQRAVALARHHAEEAAARGHNVEVEFEPTHDPVFAVVDASQIEDAVLNPVINGVEAVEGEGRVRVRVGPGAEEPASALIEIEDTGRGIAAEELARVFKPFYTTTAGGTGLGLTAVQRIAQAHGGRVEVRSEPGRGSTFTLRLPLDARA